MARGLFLSLRRPSLEQQKSCIADSGSFNYDPSFHGATKPPYDQQQQQEDIEKTLKNAGFFINRSRVLLGSGPTTFDLAKSALSKWRHFALGWAFVDPRTPIGKGTKFCVCVKELIPWIVMPLQIAYVTGGASGRPAGAVTGGAKASFGFGSGTLHGHLLAGEERFSVEWDENDRIWYEIYSFSKPACLISVIGYPYVQLRQKFFAEQSAHALLKHIKAQQAEM